MTKNIDTDLITVENLEKANENSIEKCDQKLTCYTGGRRKRIFSLTVQVGISLVRRYFSINLNDYAKISIILQNDN